MSHSDKYSKQSVSQVQNTLVHIEDAERALSKQLPAAANNIEALEQLDDAQLSQLIQTHEKWSLERSRLAAQSMQHTGQLPYVLAWGKDGVADVILS